MNVVGATVKFSQLENGERFKLVTSNPILEKLVCIKADGMRFAELNYENGLYNLSEEVVRVVYGDFDVKVVAKGTK